MTKILLIAYSIILKKSFLVKNFAKYLVNVYHVFSIILPKPREIFTKSLTNI